MKKCSSCKVKVESDVINCPLCNCNLSKIDDDFNLDYPNLRTSLMRKIWVKLLLFISIVGVAGSLAINFLTTGELVWSIVVCGSLAYIWINLYLTLKSSKNVGLLILIQVLTLSALTVVIDLAFGKLKWSTNYFIPFLITVGAFCILMLILIKPMRFRDYSIYQMVMAILGIIPLALIFFKFSNVLWAAVGSAFYSGLTFAGMFIFADRKTKNELKKRFHF